MKTSRTLLLRLPPYFGFIRHHPHDVTLPFTIAYTSSMIKGTGREVKILDVWANGWSLGKVMECINDFQPNVIFFDSSTGVIPVLKEVNGEAKKLCKVKTVACGAVPTFFPEVIFYEGSGFDVGIVGECEEASLEILAAFEKNLPLREVAGLVYWDAEESRMKKTGERALLADLDRLPFIDYSLFHLKYYRKFSFPIPLFRPVRWGHVLATRGCPYYCAFCSYDHRQSYGKEFRKASPKRVADEFQLLANNYHINAISIEDDCFTFDHDYVVEVCDEIEKRNLSVKWVVQTRADLLDKVLMNRMKQAGCVGFSLGVESGSDEVLKRLRKGVTRSQMEKTLKEAGETGMMLRLLFMVGNPDETVEEIEKSMSLAMKAKAITVQVHFCTPYPGTSFFEQENEDFNTLAGYSSYNSIRRNLSRVPNHQLMELRNRFYHRYYFSWRYFKIFVNQRLLYIVPQILNDIPLILRAFLYMIRFPALVQFNLKSYSWGCTCLAGFWPILIQFEN